MGAVPRKCACIHQGMVPDGTEDVWCFRRSEHVSVVETSSAGVESSMAEPDPVSLAKVMGNIPMFEDNFLDSVDSSLEFRKPYSLSCQTNMAPSIEDEATTPGSLLTRVMSDATTEVDTLADQELITLTTDGRSEPSLCPIAPTHAARRHHDTSFDFEFRVDGEIKTITMVRKPLGLIFDSSIMPTKIKRVKSGGHGEELGVQPGWEIMAIGGNDASSLGAEEVLATVQRHVEALPDSYEYAAKFVEIAFVADGEETTLVFPRRRLGITLGQKEGAPLTVAGVETNSQAEIRGVRAGWIVKAVAGEDLSTKEYWAAADGFEFSVTPARHAENFASFMKRAADGPEKEKTY